MTKSEKDLFLKLLPEYKKHFEQNKDSLLAKILGVFTVNTKHMKEVYIMCMENTLRLKDPQNLKYIFDLKGSLVDRKVKGKTKNTTTLKDVNFLLAAKHNSHFT